MRPPSRVGWAASALYVGLFALPVIWLVRTSLTPSEAAPSLLPAQITLRNYAALFGGSGLGQAFGVGLLEAAASAVIAILPALPAAYALARYRFAGDRALSYWLLVGRFLPFAAVAGPTGALYESIGLGDSPLAVALAHGVFNVGIATWIIEAAIRDVPRRIDETAEMDGHSFPAFFFSILMPLIAPGVMFAAAICFVFSWLETAIAGAVAAAHARPIGAMLADTSRAEVGVLAAASVLCLLPSLALMWVLRRRIANGFALGRA